MMDEKYNFCEIEARWQKRWQEEEIFRTEEASGNPKFYALEFFPYPSGAGLSVGHGKNYVPSDAFCRYKRMRGFNVLHPMGWDAFGQPAENEAIKKGRHPREMVPEYAESYKKTLQRMGCSYDWSREINSSDPAYYRWTQWFFLLFHDRGLAYRKMAAINWCPSCNTGLANEEATENKCWRCDTQVEKRPMPQWFFRITEYAEELLKDLDSLDWPEGIKQMQRDWIGRTEGAEIIFKIRDMNEDVRVFSTRPDTLPSVAFVVLAPEHPLAEKILLPSFQNKAAAYVRQAQSLLDIDRMNAGRAKTGVFTGRYAVHPVSGDAIPIWIADYVLMSTGTGAIMGIPAHDERDALFARDHGISSRPRLGASLHGSGSAIAWLEARRIGRAKVDYRMRDWLISRQRYWGSPIPMVHCESCGVVADRNLPILLPPVENYAPSGSGESPLATIPAFVNTACPECGAAAKRETDTMGGFACSSWYFFRFADPHNTRAFAGSEQIQRWLPVDLYVGGAEHAVMHLLYARFWTKVMADAGLVDFREPFKKLRTQGSVLAYTPGRRVRPARESGGKSSVIDWIALRAEDQSRFPEDQIVWRWVRMSKSKGNVIGPIEMADRYGADSLRIYTMFVAPFEDNVRWSEEGMKGTFRFLNRLWKWAIWFLPHFDLHWRTARQFLGTKPPEAHEEVRKRLHQTTDKVAVDLENFRFNPAVAALMEFVNTLYTALPPSSAIDGPSGRIVGSEALESLVLLLAPFAPHMAEELWMRLGHRGSVCLAKWPQADRSAADDEKRTIPVQINGRVRTRLSIPTGLDSAELREFACNRPNVQVLIKGRSIKRIIAIPERIVNIILE